MEEGKRESLDWGYFDYLGGAWEGQKEGIFKEDLKEGRLRKGRKV